MRCAAADKTRACARLGAYLNVATFTGFRRLEGLCTSCPWMPPRRQIGWARLEADFLMRSSCARGLARWRIGKGGEWRHRLWAEAKRRAYRHNSHPPARFGSAAPLLATLDASAPPWPKPGLDERCRPLVWEAGPAARPGWGLKESRGISPGRHNRTARQLPPRSLHLDSFTSA